MCVNTWRFQTKSRPTRVIAMFKSTNHITMFQLKHALEFGFKIVELKKKGNTPVLMGVRCLNYVYTVEMLSR
jgi:hypothetical protein